MEELLIIQFLREEWSKVTAQDLIDFSPEEKKGQNGQICREMTSAEKTVFIIIKKMDKQRKENTQDLLGGQTKSERAKNEKINVLQNMMWASIKLSFLEHGQELPDIITIMPSWELFTANKGRDKEIEITIVSPTTGKTL